MALGKTIQYTPFQETSFGYGATEIASNYSSLIPNATDVIRLTITHSSGNWDSTGHISTPSVGTAISTYNRATQEFVVKGQRQDVDAVLALLKFFPADKPASRPYAASNLTGHKTLLYKANQTSGSFADENPPAIGNTEFSAKIFNASNVQKVTGTIIWDPVEPTTGNQRPFFSTAPGHNNYSTNTYDTVAGDPLDFGIISHGSDTQNVTVKGFFASFDNAHYTSPILDTLGQLNTQFITDNSLGDFINLRDIFIGDKIATNETTDDGERFNFTGSVVEAQAFLDNLRFKTKDDTQTKTFNMHLTVDDGITGSVAVKTMYHDKALSVSTLPTTQTFKEDNTAVFDLGAVVFGNIDEMPEVNSYKAVITLDSTGTSGATSFGTTTTVDTETYSSGVLTIIDDNLTTFKQAIRNLDFVPVADFNSSFTFTVVFTFANSTIGSSYVGASQTINVTGQEASEVENISVTHNYTEDQVYYFKENTPLQIIHPINQAFKVEFEYLINAQTISEVGDLNTSNTDVTKTQNINTITFTGTRDQLNDALENLFFSPAADVNLSFPINVTVTRTGGDLTFETPSTGVFSMVGNAQTEFTYTAPSKITWAEDTTVRFENGLEILDESLEDPLLPAFGGTYKLSARTKYADGNAVASSDIAFTCDDALDATIAGTGTVADPLTITGSRVQINHAVRNFVMTPKADFTAAQEFRFEYKLERGTITDSYYALYLNFNQSTNFTAGTASDELQIINSDIKYGTDTIADLKDIYRIVDAAVDKDYTVTFTMDSNAPGVLRATASGSATVEYRPADKRLVLKGTKVDLNNTFRTLEYLPTLGSTNNITVAYFQRQDTDTIIQADGSASFTVTHDATIGKFNLDTANTNLFYAEDLQDQEDILAFTSLKITDAAEELLAGTGKPIHYVIEMTLNPTTEIFFDKNYAESGVLESGVVEETASSISFAGSKSYCNQKIKNLKFSGIADQTDNVAIVYSQSRYIDNAFDEAQATNQTALTLRAQSGGTAEALFSTDTQYFTVDSAVAENNEEINPKFLANNFQTDGYLIPVVIVDSAVATGGTTLYKLSAVSSNLPTGITIADIPYLTKADFKDAISNGIKPENVADTFIESLNYGREYEVHFKVTRRLGNGTEADIEFGKLTYKFITPPQVFEFKATNPNIRLSTNTITYDHSTQNKITANVPATTTLLAEDTLTRYFFGYVKKELGTNEFYGEDIGTSQKSLTFQEISQDTFTVNQVSETASITYNPFNDPQSVASTGTYSTFAPNSFKRTEISKAEHICIDKFGLKTILTIDYNEIAVKYSKGFEISTHGSLFGHPSGDFQDPVFAHHVGDDSGAFTLTPGNPLFPEVADDAKIGFNNQIRVSHNWMGLDEIGTTITGFSNLDPLGNTSKTITVGKSKDIFNKVGTLSYSDDTKFWHQGPGVKRVIQDNNNTRAEFVGLNIISSARGGQTISYNGGRTYYYGSTVTDHPIIAKSNSQVAARAGATSFIETQRPFQGPVTSLGHVERLAPALIRGKLFTPHAMSGIETKTGFPVLMFKSGSYEQGQGVVNFADTQTNIDFENSVDEWFDEFPHISGVDTSALLAGDDGTVVTYDYAENSLGEILLVRSTAGTGPAVPRVNEAVLIAPSGNKFKILKKFREAQDSTRTLNRYVEGVPSSYSTLDIFSTNQKTVLSNDYNRWARRFNADNVPRIKVFNDNFILPTGKAIMRRTDSYELTTLEEILGVDISSKAIDQYIVLPNNKLAYVSVNEGMIDDGLGNINIRIDSNNYRHVYITNDVENPFDFYGILTDIPFANIDGPDNIDIIGSRPGRRYSRKMFMFKALGKL